MSLNSLTTYLEAEGITVVALGSRSPTPPCVVLRAGGMSFDGRGPKMRVAIDVVGAFIGDYAPTAAVEGLQTLLSQVGIAIWDSEDWIPLSASPASPVQLPGQQQGLLISTLTAEEV